MLKRLSDHLLLIGLPHNVSQSLHFANKFLRNIQAGGLRIRLLKSLGKGTGYTIFVIYR